jgi:uncharacterized membrane protein
MKINKTYLKSLKSILLVVFILASNLAQSQRVTFEEDVEDVAAAPIDDYIWVLVLIGVVFAIFTLKTYTKQAKAINS